MLEVALSLGLLLLMGSSTIYLIHSQSPAGGPDTDTGKGAMLARSMIDSLRESSYAAVSAGCDTVYGRFIRRVYVSTDRDKEHKSVEVLVSWPLTADHTLTFNTLIGNDAYKSH